MQIESITNRILFWLLFLNLLAIFGESVKNSTSLANRKKSNHSRTIKSNKASKRQEKTSSLISSNSDDPDFDFHTTTSVINHANNLSNLNTNRNTQQSQVTAILGQSVVLPCAVRNLGVYNILWLRLKDGDVLAYDNMTITQDQRFSFAKKTVNESNILIERVKLSDSGEYACQINTQNVKSRIINLVVLSNLINRFSYKLN